MMKEFYLENEYAEFWIENGILHNIYKPDLKFINIHIAKQIVSDRLKVSGGITRPIYIDTNNAKTIDKEARDYLAQGDAMKYLSATAIIVYNKVARVGANFYVSLSRPTIPTKVFTNKTKAVQWLRQFKIQ